MSQQNENELWELLQEKPEETAPQAPGKTGKKTASAAKKSPWMFVSLGLGVALVGTVALLLTGGGNSSNPSNPIHGGNNSSAKVQELQAQVDSLLLERGELISEIDDLNEEAIAQDSKMQELLELYYAVSENLEHVEENNGTATDPEQAAKQQRTVAAYRKLIEAQNAFLRYDENTLEDCIDALMDDLDLLDQESLNAFYYVMEYMEQPYWKNKG